MFINYYELLGIEADADLVQITAAWKRLLTKYHPDLNQNDEDANEQTILLNKAYEVLSNQKKRKRFDKQLEEQRKTVDSLDPSQDGQKEAKQQSNSFHQSFEQSPTQGNSFTSAARRNAKKNRYALVFSIVGIVMGALTAIPIGLFLAWVISGFDPLGIFRQNANEAVAENETVTQKEAIAKRIANAENESVDENEAAPVAIETTEEKKVKGTATEDKSGKVEDKKAVQPKESLDPKIPDKITISYAKFGESRQSIRVEKFVEDVANKEGVVTTVTTEGLNTSNPVGRPRTSLRVTYQVNEKLTGTLSFPNGAKVNIRDAILKHSKDNARPFEKIEITYALFGKRSNKVRCEEQVAAVASQIDVVSPMTTHGLSLRNPSGIVRRELDIHYKVAGKTGELTLIYGQNVDLRKTILEHANVLDGSYVPSSAEVGLGNSDPTKTEGLEDKATKLPVAFTDKRLPIPPAAAVASSKTEIAEIFGSDYMAAKRAKAPEKLSLLSAVATEVIKLTEKENNAATCYALFEIAIDMAKESCHENQALEYVQWFELKFKIDGIGKRVEVLGSLRRELPLAIRDKDRVQAAANLLRGASKVVFRQAIDEERWRAAIEICGIYRGFCLLSGEKAKAVALKRILTSVTKKENEATRFARYLKEADAGSSDPDKMLAIGAYLCFIKQQWGKGLTYISDGSDSNLSEIAASDLAATESDYMSLGDRWWDVALDEDYRDYRLAIFSRAKYYYLLSLGKSTGLDKNKIEKRIKDANKEIWGDGFFFDSLNNFISPTTGMKLVQVRNGSFVMGEFKAVIDGFGKRAHLFMPEGPRHPITISKSFYMGQYEVSQSQWIKVMGTKPWADDGLVLKGAYHPASYVTWNEAQEFCERLSILDQRRYRLPTEAEWEFACRAGSETKWHSGEDVKSVYYYDWVQENAWKIGIRCGQRIGTKLPNAFGFYDLHGNLDEWCQDSHEPDFYSRSPEVDPINLAESANKSRRSGSFEGNAWNSRSASRRFGPPDEKNSRVGLRIVMEK